MLRALIVVAWLGLADAAVAQPPVAQSFDYDASKTVTPTFGAPVALAPGVKAYAISFGSHGRHITGEVVEGKGDVWHPAILYVHWLGDPKTTNHTEFEAEAAQFADVGVTSLLIDAPWSQPGWFEGMGASADADIRFTQNTVVDLRRSLDMLEHLPNVDRERIGYVGHDFGAMFGILLASVDHRPAAWVFMTPNTSLGAWYLWEKKTPDRDAYLAKLSAFDLAPYASRIQTKGGGVEFEFSNKDEYVTHADAQALFDATPGSKDIQWFNAGHALDENAQSDRFVWLESRILEPPSRRF